MKVIHHRRTMSSTDLIQDLANNPFGNLKNIPSGSQTARKPEGSSATAKNNHPNNNPIKPIAQIKNDMRHLHRRTYSMTSNNSVPMFCVSPRPVGTKILAVPPKTRTKSRALSRGSNKDSISLKKMGPSKTASIFNTTPSNKTNSQTLKKGQDSKSGDIKSLIDLIEASTEIAPSKVTTVETLEIQPWSYEEFVNQLNYTRANKQGFRFGAAKMDRCFKRKGPEQNWNLSHLNKNFLNVKQPSKGLFTIQEYADLKDSLTGVANSNCSINTTAASQKTNTLSAKTPSQSELKKAPMCIPTSPRNLSNNNDQLKRKDFNKNTVTTEPTTSTQLNWPSNKIGAPQSNKKKCLTTISVKFSNHRTTQSSKEKVEQTRRKE